MLVVLDSGPLGLLSNPSDAEAPSQCRQWMIDLIEEGNRAVVAEIADYEVRRELLRAGKDLGLERLDTLIGALGLEPITTTTMRRAARLWAEARRDGRPTAPDPALDGDVILAAQAIGLTDIDDDVVVVVATTNPKHLSRFVPSRPWDEV